ncbi:LmeA family phospholipid-binding protein [Nodosilinea sp. AN01ver1]|uniref:LmeA family phospholipid-binding protein n=1 Tax=Nodosilinea sp. AN01ver1 TaxID=3423362 RepID=UPI003D3182EE
MAKGNSDLGEQALSKAVEMGLSTQLDAAETLEAEIHANPGTLVQGEVESADIQGRGLVIKDDLRTEELKVKTDGMAIDPIKAAFGNIELTRPTNAAMAAKLTQADIERACNSDYIQRKLQKLEVKLDGQPVQLKIQQVQVSLPGDGRVAIATDVQQLESGEQQHVAFSATPAVDAQGYQLMLNDVQMDPNNTSEPLTQSLLAAANDLLDLRQFSLSGMTFQVEHIDVQKETMTLQAKAHLEKFPGS